VKAVNLIPAEQRAGGGSIAGRSGGAAYVVVGLLIVLAGLTALYASAHHELVSKEAEASRLTAEASEAERAASALAPYAHFVTLREERVSDVQQLAGTRFDWAHTMHELGRVLPAGSVSLSSVQGTIGAASTEVTTTPSTTPPSPTTGTTSSTAVGGSVSSSTPAGSAPVLTIAGCASSQAKVAETMDRLRLMNGVSEVSLQSAQKAGSPSGGAGGGGSCANGASFAMTVDFEGLPAPQKATPKASTTASSSSASSGASAPPSSGSSEEGQVAR
jgi:hypothetical protein